jgi:serine/threonine protein kinase
MDEKKQRIELMTTHTASGLRPTEEIGAEPILSAEDLPAFQGTHGNYDLGAEIARGGMGRIVEARDRRQDRPVALKFLLRPDAVSAKRFAREAWITGRLQHPSIIPLYESGRWETGEPFFAMKLVRGASLAEVLRSKGTYEERIALLPHLVALTEALAYAHVEGVVHRDLKPSNVLVGAFGETVVID